MRLRELPALSTVLSTLILVILIFLGSRGFKDFDPALISYAVAIVFTAAAIVYRYTLWITHPPTWRYAIALWQSLCSRRTFRHLITRIPLTWWHDIFGQTFILKRSFSRWFAHMSIFWGVLLSLLITLPLTFGWIHFSLVPPNHYQLWFFGLPMFQFPIEAGTGFAIFHALDFTALLLIIGVALALRRRASDSGLRITQRFGFDIVPLILLLAIAVTGLALTASALWWEGRFYSLLSRAHEITVVAWLLSIPFGKLFHMVQRPASIGVSLYQTINQAVEQEREQPNGRCKRCEQALPSQRFVNDLKATLVDLNQNYDLGDDRGWLQDYCPTCKRVLRGRAYYQLMGKRFL